MNIKIKFFAYWNAEVFMHFYSLNWIIIKVKR